MYHYIHSIFFFFLVFNISTFTCVCFSSRPFLYEGVFLVILLMDQLPCFYLFSVLHLNYCTCIGAKAGHLVRNYICTGM